MRVYEAVPEQLIRLMEEERKRLAREIHDGPAQSLTNVTMRLEVVKKLMERDRRDDAEREIERLQQLIRTAVNDARRMIFDLRPTFLENGIQDAVRLYAERFTQTFDIPVHVNGRWSDADIYQPVSVTLFRVYQEALHNVYKHAQATEVFVSIFSDESRHIITVRDNGRGFDPSAPTNSYGIRGMQERAAMIGAMLRVQSCPGQGTTVCIEVPLSYE